MRAENRRRQGWNYDPPPMPKSTRSEIYDRDARSSASTRHLVAGLLTILIAMLIIAGSVTAFSVIDFKRIPVPAALQHISVSAALKGISVPAAIKRIDSSIPFHKSTAATSAAATSAAATSAAATSAPATSPAATPAPATSSAITSLPAIHNSPDTQCNNGQQCTDEEFADLVDSLRRQWAITPEDLRSKCAVNATYPSLEQCILRGTMSWLEKNPNGEAPWINPKNFDTAIMDLCQKDPKSLSICQKP
jgi:hypothetical protein